MNEDENSGRIDGTIKAARERSSREANRSSHQVTTTYHTIPSTRAIKKEIGNREYARRELRG